jgi:hypothetical protein
MIAKAGAPREICSEMDSNHDMTLDLNELILGFGSWQNERPQASSAAWIK